MNNLSVKNMVILAFLAVIITLQEEILTFLPNVQLTVFLLVLYSKKLGCKNTLLIVTLHVLFDNLWMASLNPIYMTFMWIGWAFIPILLSTVFKNINKTIYLALCGILFSLLYSWIYILPNCLIYSMPFLAYLMADIIFEIILSASSFLSILWLYEPCSKVFDTYLRQE